MAMRRKPMGIVRLSGRDAVRLSTEAREREGRRGVDRAPGGGSRPVVVWRGTVTMVGNAATRHSTADRTRVRHGRSSEGSADGPHEVSGGGVRVHDGGDLHPALAAHRTAREVDPGEPMHERGDGFGLGISGGGWPRRSRHRVKRASTRAIREQAEVANAHEAARHDVQEKASQEFVGLERHDLHAVVVGVVFPAEPDAAVAVIDEPIIRERDAVRVPPEVVEHLLGAGEGPLRIHDPVDGPQLTEEAGEGAAIGQIGGAAGEGELAGVEGAAQAGEIFRAKDGRQRSDRKQEGRSTGDPPRADQRPRRRR